MMTELEIKPLNFEVVNVKQIENVIDELSKKIIASHFQLVEIKDWFWPIFESYETKNAKEKKEVDEEMKQQKLKFKDLSGYIEFLEKQILIYKSFL